MNVVALVTDLFFATKIKSTADALGTPLKAVRKLDDLDAALTAGATLAIIDMNADGVDHVEAIRRCKSAASPPRVIAYLSHVQKDLATAAQSAGADQIMPRSAFSAQLPDLLAQE